MSAVNLEPIRQTLEVGYAYNAQQAVLPAVDQSLAPVWEYSAHINKRMGFVFARQAMNFMIQII